MKVKATVVALLAVILISSSVSASPLTDSNRINSIWSLIYNFSIRTLNRFELNGVSNERTLVGGDADDYANGRNGNGQMTDKRRIVGSSRVDPGTVNSVVKNNYKLSK